MQFSQRFFISILLASFSLINGYLVPSCQQRSVTALIQRQQLEEQYRRNSSGLTILFGHVHHAGGTAVCRLAKNHTNVNEVDNCNHPLEFVGEDSPTRGTREQQLAFQKESPWGFYAVEVKMPQDMISGGPFLYALVMRHPYLLLLSHYRRAVEVFNYKGNVEAFMRHQFQKINVSISTDKNYYRGQSGFILGQYGPTEESDASMIDRVCDRLEYFSVILLTEHMRKTGKLFSTKFGWNTDNFGQRKVNSNGGHAQLFDLAMTLSASDKAMIRQYLYVDLIAYRYAWCLVKRELRLINIQLGPYLYEYLESLFD